MSDYLDRSRKLLGDAKIDALESKVILVIGLGGVGGTALEALARSGFKNFVLVDCDKVDVTNLNRQLLFTEEDIGKTKVDAAKTHLLKINPNFTIRVHNFKVGEEPLESLDIGQIDFVVDAIDYVEGKLQIYDHCLRHNIPFVSSLGMGNRIDPEQVTITKLNKTENDPLAKKIRYEAKHRGFDLKNINVIFSKEIPVLKSKTPASIMMVTSTAGLLIAKYVLTTIL